MKRDLENFGVLITGGGTGIGKACAAEMYSHGALVTICGRTEENLKQSVQEIVESHQDGGVIQYVTCDVTDEEQVLETVLAADEFGEGLDGVVSTGGGIVLLEENRTILKKNKTYFLEANIEDMYERAIKRENDRPLLKGMDITEFKDLYMKRRDLYIESATATIDVGKKSIKDLTIEIINNEKNII